MPSLIEKLKARKEATDKATGANKTKLKPSKKPPRDMQGTELVWDPVTNKYVHPNVLKIRERDKKLNQKVY